MQEEDKSFTGLILSLLIHAAVVALLIFMPKPPEVVQPDRTEITILDKSKPAQSIIEDTKVNKKDLIEDLKEKAHYLSKTTQRVKQEMKARRVGKTQNEALALPTPSFNELQSVGQNQQGGGSKGGGEKSPPAQDQEIHSSLTGLQPKPHQIGGNGPGAQEGFGKNLMLGSSSLREYIPGVKEGSFTALNTDQFTYYTFFERVNEQIVNRWTSAIRQYLSSLTDSQQSQLAKFDRSTQVEIVLSSDGHYLKAFIHHSSGDQGLDMAPVDSFQAAAPFLNPPKGLVEDDGLIHLHYNFLVLLRPTTGLGAN